MTIDRDNMSPIDRTLSPNIAGRGREIKRWKSEDVVFKLLKNPIPVGEDSIVEIVWALVAEINGNVVYSIQMERDDLRILSSLTGESLRVLQEDYGIRGFFSPMKVTMYGSGTRESLGEYLGGKSDDEIIGYLLDAALDSLDVIEDPEEF
ncbi:MAG: hypothetical protein ACI4NI_07950 [Candidatus Ornithospirochaeta sp.]